MCRTLLTGLLLSLVAGTAPAQQDCARGEVACRVADGSYHVRLPDSAAAQPPAVMFLHGYGADALAMIRNPRVTDALLARGFAVIAPNGRGRDGADGGGWSFMPGRPQRRDEAAFLQSVRDDAVARFGLDSARIFLGGYSIGGSMTSYIACAAPDSFAAYVPVAGSFWRPHPDRCAGPVRLLHTHGWTDGTVPLEGRPLRGGQIMQGDVFAAFQVWRAANGCDGLRATRFDTSGPFWRRAWTDCAPGSALELALHPGGHLVPDGWADMAADWLATLPPR
ncbi:polyhydroxybutyrate depolymerase [Meridianimarinicoccus roseus]|uniref:Polyhydroxybutyrate depolymerase n=1 Tax=Meridianimarinicoccus roseus TaxID=2072018 RepID=A0A2V2LNX8_9RHOB|nr:alpha/beta fold hydrolase [Meridianimarinicoccus roseus]PWR03383.1 polyhydroxybutyrate depolymerase [Meridianimarinicoccus roseus]